MYIRIDYVVSDLCAEIDELKKALAKSEAEKEKWKADYWEMLKRDRKHNEAMAGNLLKLIMTPGVQEACEKNGAFKMNFGSVK